jgi:hypothetical protein
MSVPRTPAAIRIAQLFKRRLTTHWSPKEERVMRQLKKDHRFDDLDELTVVELYYAFERKKGDKGIHRRDLYTFLNNYGGEVDRAALWAEKFPNLVKGVKRTPKPQPDRWPEFLAAVYPEAREHDFWRVGQSIQDEYRQWEKGQK